ncbi:MAG TPA: aspartate aminotransferase family protein [Ramlibacter sp.]|uniref:aspartate aminotransferase family protein n=1 Tax=Ramlibacter sp. TaxID=1917967 RepID=UPI002B9130AF|nr:aspartate aminotransferase family protein [Ramlibacter sp.]HVZ43850.1 aspartate aminotransferase family protein [Ramlibacter sp.]
MDRNHAREILDQWVIPTEEGSYMGGIDERPILAAANGSTVVDIEGNEYLDFQSGQMGAAIGHRHPRVMESIRKSTESFVHASNIMLNVPRLELHERLGHLFDDPLQRTLFLVTGSDTIEASVDLARKATGGLDILGMHDGLHGSTSFLSRSLSFAWKRGKHAAIAPATSAMLTPHCYRCPVGAKFPSCDYLCLKASMELADANFTSKPAAVIAEPIVSAGGVIEPPPGYFQALRRACDDRGMLIIFDEAQTGLGKTGKMFGYQHQGVVPDIMALSKHFGGGMPVSAVCTSDAVAKKAVANGFFATRSHATDPMACAAGVASLDVIVEEDLPGRAARIEERMKAAFRDMAKRYDIIGDIRGRGVLLGMELVTDHETKAPANREAAEIDRLCLKNGLIIQLRGTGPGRRNVFRFVPPMTTTDEEIDRGLNILEDAMAQVMRTRVAS